MDRREYNRKELVIYGAGIRCRKLLAGLEGYPVEIKAIFDADVQKEGQEINEIKIHNINELMNYNAYDICICIADRQIFDSVKKMLINEHGYRENKIYSEPKIIKKYLKGIVNNIKVSAKNANKKVIFESRFGFGLGGIEAWTKTVSIALLKSGIDVSVLARSSTEDSALIDIVNGKNIISYGQQLINYFTNNMPLIFVSSQPTEELMIATMLKERFPDKICIFSVIHGGKNSIYNEYMQYERWIDKFFGVSKRIVADLQERGISKERVAVITCPFEHSNNGNRNYSDKNTSINIGYAGRIEYSQKRFDLIMKLIGELEKRKINYRFEIAGDGQAAADIAEFIKKNNLSNRIVTLGSIQHEDIIGFWSNQDIAINMSDYEGHSISQMEAMAAGCVPVVTNTSGTEDDIIDGENGYIVDLGDVEKAVKRIIYLSENRQKLQNMGIKAYKSMIEKGSLDEHIAKWINEIEQVHF